MALTVLAQTIEVTELSATVVTDVVVDTTTGEFVREFRYYGLTDQSGGLGPLLLTIRSRSLDKSAVQYQSGPLTL